MKIWISNRGMERRREGLEREKLELMANCLKVRHVPSLALNIVNTIVK